MPKILPGTGRGTARRVVEGALVRARAYRRRASPPAPSTMLRMVPLPVPGRICLTRSREAAKKKQG